MAAASKGNDAPPQLLGRVSSTPRRQSAERTVHTVEPDSNVTRLSRRQSIVFVNPPALAAMAEIPDEFFCFNCGCDLGGERYVLRDTHPTCTKCYEQHYANLCDECTKPISIDSKDLSYKNKHWHEDCFLCCMCKMSLVDKPFGSKNAHIYCAACHDQLFASRCDGCNDVFKAGMKKLEYRGSQWHEKCFVCFECKHPIGTKSFIPKDSVVYCCVCYEGKFSTKCVKCSKPINSGGVTYKEQPYHRECFICSECQNSLAGQRFTSKDDGIYCSDCYAHLFAKRCFACDQPITGDIVGIGGAKFISYDERHWHNQCFCCSQCQMSLVGKGFISDCSDIVCPDCAKARMIAKQAEATAS